MTRGIQNNKNELRYEDDILQLVRLALVIYFIQSIHMSVVRHTWAFQKSFPVLIMQYFKTILSYDPDFLNAGRHPLKKQIVSVISNSLVLVQIFF